MNTKLAPLFRPALATLLVIFAASVAPAQTVPAPAPTPEETLVLSPFTVETKQDRGYGSANALGASRVNIPLIDTPATVVVINEEFLKDFAVIDNQDAFRYVSGMSENSLPYNGQVIVRGFQAGNGIAFRDGLPDNIEVGGGPMNDFAVIERVEIMKGPNGVLYGSHAPGGVVNQVSKKPRFTAGYGVKFTAGSWNLYRGEIDATGPLVKEKLAYRLIVMSQKGETLNHGPQDKMLIAPSLIWRPTKRTTVTAQYLYYNPTIATSRNSWFADSSGRISMFLPRRGYFDEDDEQRQHWVYSSDLSLEQTLSQNWRLRVVGRHTAADEDKFNYNKVTYRFVGPSGAALRTPAGAAATFRNYTFAQAFANPDYRDIIVDRVRRRDLIEAERLGGYVDLVGDFELLKIKHKIITSAQWVKSNLDNKQQLWNYPSTSVITPTYVSNPLSVSTVFRETTNNVSDSSGSAFSIQDNVSFLEGRLHAVAGARYNRILNTSFNRLNRARSSEREKDTSYRAGLLFKPLAGLSVYGNFSQTFIPVSGINFFGVPNENQTGETREAGIKLEAFNNRLIGTVAVFDLTLDNFSRQILVDVANGIVANVQAGTLTSKGVEIDLNYQPTDQIALIVSLGDTTTTDEKGIGNRGVSQGVNYKVFSKYSFTEGSWKGLIFGAGYVFNNRAAGDGLATFYLPSYGLFDAVVGYRQKRWSAQVNITNLTDKIYSSGAVNDQFVSAGRPREFRFTFSRTF